MKQLRKIKIQNDLADHCENPAMSFYVVNLDIAGNQTVERIECEPINRNGNPPLFKLTIHELAPVAGEASAIDIPSAPEKPDDKDQQNHSDRGLQELSHRFSQSGFE